MNLPSQKVSLFMSVSKSFDDQSKHLPAATVHPSSIVHPSAKLAPGVRVGPYCTVGENVTIGSGSVLRSHVNIEGHTTVGERNEFFPFCSVGAPPQDLKYKGEPTLLVIGHNNIIRECVTLQPGTVQGGGKTLIGNKNLLMAYCHVAHDCVIGDENIIANSVQLSGHVTLENQTVLGGMSAIHQFCKVGDLAMLGGGSMVVQDVPPYSLVQGDHASFRGLNIVGLKRKNFDKQQIATVKKVYLHLIQDPAPTVEESVKNLELALGPDDDRDVVTQIVTFIRQSSRGVVRRAASHAVAS